MTLANLVTALLLELSKTYVTEDSVKDKKMRKRIKQTSELINSYKEISNVMIKGNPFHKSNQKGDHSGKHKKSKFNIAVGSLNVEGNNNILGFRASESGTSVGAATTEEEKAAAEAEESFSSFSESSGGSGSNKSGSDHEMGMGLDNFLDQMEAEGDGFAVRRTESNARRHNSMLV